MGELDFEDREIALEVEMLGKLIRQVIGAIADLCGAMLIFILMSLVGFALGWGITGQPPNQTIRVLMAVAVMVVIVLGVKFTPRPGGTTGG